MEGAVMKMPKTKDLPTYLERVQVEAIQLDALLEGLAILRETPDGSNACFALVEVLQSKAKWIMRALDSVNLPRA